MRCTHLDMVGSQSAKEQQVLTATTHPPPNPRQELLLELDFRFTRRHSGKKSRKKTKQTPTINDQTKNK